MKKNEQHKVIYKTLCSGPVFILWSPRRRRKRKGQRIFEEIMGKRFGKRY